MPYEGGAISIDNPSQGAAVVVGAAFRVTGTTEPVEFSKRPGEVENVIPPDAVMVGLDGGVAIPARALAADWSAWEADLRITSAGAHQIIATAEWWSSTNQTESDALNITAIATPLDLVTPAGAIGTVQFVVAVSATHPNGITTVVARADNQPFTKLQRTGDHWSGTLQLAGETVPAGGRQATIDLEATSGDGLVHRQSLQRLAKDMQLPSVLSFTPADGAKLPGTEVGATVEVAINVEDPGRGQLTSGVSTVEVKVDSVATAAQPADESGRWTAEVFVPGSDDHVLTVQAWDASGHWSTPVSHRVVVTTRADFLRDLSRVTYLQDLLRFTTEQVLTRSASTGDDEPPFATPGLLGEALRRDLDQVAHLGAAEAIAPVRTLRMVVEGLARYMRPAPPAPLAGWSLHEGAGTTANDSASGRAQGAIEAATWVPGAPHYLRFEPDDSAHVAVTLPGAQQTRVHEQLTLVAAIRPSRDTAEPGIIINKEGEYELARYPDGTIQWALANTTPGWTWVSTGVVAPVGQWSHIAMSYDGRRARLFVDGVRRHMSEATGVIGDIDPAHSELWIGGRPTSPQYFAGDISDVSVFDHALSEAAVHRLLDRSDDDEGAKLWVDDNLPTGAVTAEESDSWSWVDSASGPASSSGVRCHRSDTSAGRHQHLFTVEATAFTVDPGDEVVTDVWVDPVHPPRQVMLQWQDGDGSWEHRAYWGEDLIDWGVAGTTSRHRVGDLPTAGVWTTLRTPAEAVGLARETVHGVGYVLFDGSAAWDATGRTTAAAAAARSGHVAAAYGALLRVHGTSEVELRLARGASPQDRAALAQRLGITLGPTRPDELDELLLDASEMTSQEVLRLFGYSDPLDADPAPPAMSALTRWRLSTLRETWRRADAGVAASPGQAPVVDPEVLLISDVADPTSAAAALLLERIGWRSAQLSTLDTLRSAAADDASAVSKAYGTVLNTLDLDELASSRRAGQDITAGLLAAGLTTRDLARLIQLRDLAATGPLRDDEWGDLVAALVRVMRRRNWITWREAESTADVLVDPAVFRDSLRDGEPALPAYIDGTARQEWLDRLAARALAVESVLAAQAAAVSRADDVALPMVRDALVSALDPGTPGVAVVDALSSVLYVDVGAAPEDVTSRVDQAIEALQGLLFAARSNRLTPQDPWPPPGPQADWVLRETAAYPRADFDEEWKWMSRYAAWQAAASVFFRPELLLFPTLRPDPTPNFLTLLNDLTSVGGDLTPTIARRQAARFHDRIDDTTRALLADAVVRQGPPAVTLANLVLTDQLNPDGLDLLAKGQRGLIAEDATLSEIPRALLEVLWLVPLHLAISLSRVGHQLAAIDWLRTLYAYDKADSERIVFAGFRLETEEPGSLQRPLNWLLGSELNPHRIAEGRPGAQLRFTLLQLARCLAEQADAEFTSDSQESRPRARALYIAATRSLRVPEFDDPSGSDMPVVPANPLLAALRGRVDANLRKLRRGLTIAGVQRPAPLAPELGNVQLVLPSSDGALSPPTQPPQSSPYRFATLMTRAQQLLALATQVEAAFLSAMEAGDREGYTEQGANSDLEFTKARVEVQQAALEAADDEVRVAQAQGLRARRQAETLETWVAGGESDWEQQLLSSYQDIAGWRTAVAYANAAATIAGATASASAPGAGSLPALVLAAGGGYLATAALAGAEANSQEAATRASFERRAQQWQLEALLARDDESIVNMQAQVYRRRSAIAAAERTAAQTEERHAQATVNYLAGRRLTAEMYAWMAGQLGDVYRYLLRQATSVAMMAQQQLAFERQQTPPEIIKTNYWVSEPAGEGADRRGLTGSARLLRDLTELDQHAFETNRRKLNLEHAFALSRSAPEAFAAFRRTGVLPFATPMEAFDRRFPGHLLRTLRRVRLSLVALVPPGQGIAATLTCSGQSRVVVGQYGVFRPITLTRPPETVAYTTPVNATGVFDLDVQPELKYFFEGHGVDTTWELRLPRPANAIDYRSIAEVTVTLEYTAMADADYARQVTATLPQTSRGTVAVSIRDETPDGWYALLEDELSGSGALPPVSVPLTRRHFPQNLERLRLEAVTLLTIRPEGDDEPPNLTVHRLDLIRGRRKLQGGAATAAADVISTRLGTGTAWLPLLDPPAQVAVPGEQPTPWDPEPIGDWELALGGGVETREALRSGRVSDLVLVFSYRGELPPWPRS